MFDLRTVTPSGWVDTVLPHLDELLVEQAHLEKKAAAAAIRYLFRYPEHTHRFAPLSALAREELEHFEQVLELLERRGLTCGRFEPGPYAERLLAAVRPRDPERLLDQLLCSALIEARSCDRMRALADGLVDRDDELASFYRELVKSEARHHVVYVDIARELFGSAAVDPRLEELLDHEARALAEGSPQPRLHG